jgi:elongation factor 1-beta
MEIRKSEFHSNRLRASARDRAFVRDVGLNATDRARARRPTATNHSATGPIPIMTSLPAYDLSVDELRIALSFANTDVVLKSVVIQKPATPSPVGAAPVVAAAVTKKDKAASAKKEAAPAKKEADEDDFDVFGDDDEDEEPVVTAPVAVAESGTESRAEMMARLKKGAEERLAKKEASQRTLCAIEIKPWDVEQDLTALWKKITTTVVQEGLKWGESCNLADVAYGIKKIQCTFVMGVSNSSDDVVDAILAMEDEVQSCEVTSMNVL